MVESSVADGPNAEETRVISGCIDGFYSITEPFGWTLDRSGETWSSGDQLNILARKNGQIVATTYSRHRRGDLKHSPQNIAGFHLKIDASIEPQDWTSGIIKVIAIAPDGNSHELLLTSKARESLVHVIVADYLRAGKQEDRLYQLADALGKNLNIEPHIAERFRTVAQHISGKPIDLNFSKASQVFIRQATLSLDGSSILGADGHIFLSGGSNNVRQLYRTTVDAETNKSVEAWLSVFEKRLRLIQSLQSRYLQLIIPEKISALPELYPENLETPTQILKNLEYEISIRSDLNSSYISCYKLFREDSQRAEFYHKADTHLSARGAFNVFCAILQRLMLQRPQTPIFKEVEDFWVGDLSSRFFSEPLLNQAVRLTGQELSSVSHELRQTLSYDPPHEGHIGKRRVWVNASAPFKMKVVAFANSFFERAGSPSNLSWWFARYFQEFHFLWEPDFDTAYIKELKPDLIIGQTIERFLHKVARE